MSATITATPYYRAGNRPLATTVATGSDRKLELVETDGHRATPLLANAAFRVVEPFGELHPEHRELDVDIKDNPAETDERTLWEIHDLTGR
ncbi:hypothetical protein [Nocardia sp. NPDC058705]|uniref:hypothetical protein n=1 Tax=Nocardia sp. NPDC058705 TaxID=3346609 RepID=UPI003688C6BB